MKINIFHLFLKLDHLQAINQHKRMLCKVNAYIQAFVKSRSIATTHELRECLKDYLESGNHFNDLKLGPLMKMVSMDNVW